MSTTGVKSPKSPRNTLKESLDVTQKLFKEASRAFVSRETAAKAMGYSGLTGSSLTFLASLVGYGLLAKKGSDVKVSDLAIEILHPTNEEQKKQAVKKAALNPPLFADLALNHGDCSEAVLASKLIQDKFPPEGAKKTARVFIANKEFANLEGSDYSPDGENGSNNEPKKETPEAVKESKPLHVPLVSPILPLKPEGNVLATYKIPLGANEAELIFRGQSLEPDDFETLQEYVRLFKRQYERKLKTAPAIHLPAKAIWKNKDNDMPVTITEVMGSFEGVTYYKTETGTGLPESELTFEKVK